jgi:hypothetical protein
MSDDSVVIRASYDDLLLSVDWPGNANKNNALHYKHSFPLKKKKLLSSKRVMKQ